MWAISRPYLGWKLEADGLRIPATTADGPVFSRWVCDDSSTNASIGVALNRSKSRKAVFGTTPTLSPVGAGSILSDAAGTLVPHM